MLSRKQWLLLGRVSIRSLFVILGSLLVACSLQFFMIPNRIIDGGVTGVSILAAYRTALPLGFFLVVFSLPFFVYGYRQIGKTFAFLTLLGVTSLALGTIFLSHMGPATRDLLNAAVFGGILQGIGVGLVLRYGGSLDGVEILGITISRHLPFSIGQIVMFVNFFILCAAGFFFGWDHAMYSLICYFIAFKTMDIVVEGLDETKSVWIISDHSAHIAQVILQRLGRGVTYLYGEGGYTREGKMVIFCIVTRLEQAKLKTIIAEVDPNAFLAIGTIHDVQGGRFKKEAIH
ncbi:YitT family protein [Pasteuria penetrans]|uniref:YitT family protein n=1 Tax=Pasteuria penetrans TaxID=86005 RepID=UPI000FA05302|nr:YitT family protein [Pasteuria penetrans]